MTGEFVIERLRRAMLPADPLNLFQAWFDQARDREPWDGGAAVLSTVGGDGVPSARVVLVRGAKADGFRFFTNYDSRKGRELALNPNCALVFWWPSLVRQVRVEGVARKLEPSESDAYFAERPRDSRIGAWASVQSARIESRQSLEDEVSRVAASFDGREVPRPPNWGGYLVRPRQIEFWQGAPSRLHDRFRYRLNQDGRTWTIDRLSP